MVRAKDPAASKNMSIIEKVKSLNLPLGQYVVVASGSMEAVGIRKAGDADIAVTQGLLLQMRTTGEWEEIVKYDKVFLKREGFDIIPELNWDKYSTTVEEAISSAMIIGGVAFMNLDELCKFKRALGREKDFADIVLVEEYLKGQS